MEQRDVDDSIEKDAERSEYGDENSVDDEALIRDDFVQVRIEQIVLLLDAVVQTAAATHCLFHFHGINKSSVDII